MKQFQHLVKLKSLMQPMIYIHYSLLFFKNQSFKYTTTFTLLHYTTLYYTRLTFNSFSLFYFFFISSFSFLLSLFKLSCTRKHHVYKPYHIFHTLSFCYVMYYTVSEICLDGQFLEDCFYCYSQQSIFVAAKSP